ncbi:hypothetical protein BJX76DRAFT_49533 [Aspergillus varians]
MKLTDLPLAFFIPQILAQKETTVVHPDPVPEISNAQWTSDATRFDGPKVVPINASAYDWWYFDAIQTSNDPAEQASIVVTFYTATPGGFDFLVLYNAQGLTSLALAEAGITWPNGTTETYVFNATEATITTVGNAVEGVWQESEDRASFSGSPDMTTYQVKLESSRISGTLTLQSVAPPHYPCGPVAAGESLQVAPHVGWANAVPDAISTVQLSVRGYPYEFTGIGYHDKNWGDRNFVSTVGSWYWGHGRVGPYSVVWFDFLSPEKESFVSAYVSRDNEIVVARCDGITVRPFGENSTYPPLASTGNPNGFKINIELPDGGELDFTAHADRLVSRNAEGTRYARWTGTLEGTVDGQALTGDTVFEHFHFFEE